MGKRKAVKKEAIKTGMRRFVLRRKEDISGVSGVGIVAEGVKFTSGFCTMTWLTPLSSIAIYHSVDTMIEIHGHEESTVLEWLDD